jgi:hypothetical protein
MQVRVPYPNSPMKFSLSLIPFLLTTVVGFSGTPELLWETHGLVGPESVVFDPATQVFYVSNLGSHGKDAVPGDGFISRVSKDGELLELKWVTGLDDPKGLALVGGRLYVGDEPALVEIDISTAKIVGHYAPPDGPGNFNDCTADSEGNVYVCCGRLLTIFRLHEGKFESWLKLDATKTGSLNGLRAEKDRLLLGGWSIRDANGKEQLGHISTVSYANKSIGRLGSEPVCHIDGLEPDGVGGYTVTDWLTGDVLHVSALGKVDPIMKLVQGTADHTYLKDRQLIILPLMNDNVLRAYRWAPGGTK